MKMNNYTPEDSAEILFGLALSLRRLHARVEGVLSKGAGKGLECHESSSMESHGRNLRSHSMTRLLQGRTILLKVLDEKTKCVKVVGKNASIQSSVNGIESRPRLKEGTVQGC